MKKLIAFLLITVFAINANAQVQRKRAVQETKDTAAAATGSRDAEMKKKDMMRELNLTKQQKLKLKEMRQSGKSKMDEVQNDPKLSDTEKKVKIKELKKQQMESTLSVLNEEQKAKLKQMRKEKKGDKKGDKTMEEQ